MKKVLLCAVVAVLLSSGQAFGFGIGAEVSAPITSSGVGGALAITFKLDKVPYVFGLGGWGNANTFHLGATADYWMAQGTLIKFLDWYAGPGVFLNITTGNDSGIEGGLRIPVGIDAYFLERRLELFLELAPAFGVSFTPFQFPTIALQNALGFRFWF